MIHGTTRRPAISMMATKVATLTRVMAADRAIASQEAVAPSPPKAPPRAGSITRASTMTRSSTISQPTAIRPRSVSRMRLSCKARIRTTVLATDSAQTEDQPGPGRPAKAPRQRHAEQCGDRDLNHGAGQGYRPDRHQVLERKMQADREHEQDHADFGQFVGKRLIGDESWRKRTNHDAGKEISNQRRYA